MSRAIIAVSLCSILGCSSDPTPDDAATSDVGTADAGVWDEDASRDAGAEDAALIDAALIDVGPADVGPPDAGDNRSDAGPLGTWGEGFSLPPPDGRDSFAQFGGDVAIADDGRRVAVGDIGSAQVSVYEPAGDGWARVDVIDAPASGGSFGWDVDLDADGTTLAVSAPAGRVVFVFERGAIGWGAPTELRLIGSVPAFGPALSLSADGRRLVVGAGSSLPSQGVYVFDRVGDVWSEGLGLTLPAGTVEAGGRVAMDALGLRIVSGDPGRSARVGSAAVYDRTASGWGAPTPLDVPPAAAIFAFDVSISRDGTTTVISDILGTVSAYRLASAGWARETIPPPPAAVNFGSATVVSAEGRTVWSGDVGAGGGAGQVTEHVREAEGWRHASTLPTPAGSRDFGGAIDVSADGRVLVVGDVNGGSGDMGTAYVFRR